MEILTIGHSSCIPDMGSDTSCFVIAGKHLVDTGWCAPLAMRRYGPDPLDLDSLLLTHCHHDHTIGLPSLLFVRAMRQRPEATPLTIAGPAEHLETLVQAAFDFLQVARFPEVRVPVRLLPLAPGDTFVLGGLRFESCAMHHVSGKGAPEPALAYRVTDPSDGASCVFSGDVHPLPPAAGAPPVRPLARFARGAGLLVHDTAHTPPEEAAAVAREAGIGRLLLTHYVASQAPAILAAARKVFPDTWLAADGSVLTPRGAS